MRAKLMHPVKDNEMKPNKIKLVIQMTLRTKRSLRNDKLNQEKHSLFTMIYLIQLLILMRISKKKNSPNKLMK